MHELTEAEFRLRNAIDMLELHEFSDEENNNPQHARLKRDIEGTLSAAMRLFNDLTFSIACDKVSQERSRTS